MSDSGTDTLLSAERIPEALREPLRNPDGYVLEVTLAGDAAERKGADRWLANYPFDALRSLGAVAADTYVPAAGQARDPYNDDRGPPLAQLMLAFDGAETLREALSSSLMTDALATPSSALRVTANSFLRYDFPVVGERCEPQDAEGFSYVVRYHGPTENQAEFVSSYLAYHPAALASLPRIRNIVCYVPLEPGSAAPGNNYILGNEVMFGTMEEFNEAMQSNARRRMRENRHPGPVFTGRNTHFPMQRQRLFGPDRATGPLAGNGSAD